MSTYHVPGFLVELWHRVRQLDLNMILVISIFGSKSRDVFNPLGPFKGVNRRDV